MRINYINVIIFLVYILIYEYKLYNHTFTYVIIFNIRTYVRV